MNGTGGGLSPDGTRLVLVEPPNYQYLRRQSRFVVLRPRRPAAGATITLKGEFGFDALSPDGRTLYLLQHADKNDLVRYLVRAYDLRANRLVGARDRRQARAGREDGRLPDLARDDAPPGAGCTRSTTAPAASRSCTR